jgi:DNA-binding NarL/FixJ family response regulator
VVVTDLYVTRGQEGVESIAALVREAGGTPVVVLSGWPVEEEEARAAGVRRVLRKPFGVEELVGVVEEVLGGRVPGGVSGAGEETSGAPMT